MQRKRLWGPMSNWREVFRQTTKALAEAGFAEAEAEARVITAHVYGGDFSSLCLRFFDACGKEDEVKRLLEGRLSGQPLAYVLHEKYFYGRPFYVDEHVLIPRYDTESVAERALLLARANGYQTALDLCCGSGVLGVTLGAEEKFSRICFADISGKALAVAQRNAEQLIPEQKACFVQGDFLENIRGRFDLVVCNPPYISVADYAGLEPQIRGYEPQTALLADHDGYAFYERAAKEIPAVLNAGGALVLEVGDTQAERVRFLLNEGGFVKISCGCDLGGRPRWVSGFTHV